MAEHSAHPETAAPKRDITNPILKLRNTEFRPCTLELRVCFRLKWKQTIAGLEELAQLDLEYQDKKAHDKNLCGAVARLTGMLGRYIQLHNDALECMYQNLQVQKTAYIAEVVKAIINRILELKHFIRKLECTSIQFMGHGLTDHKITPFDAELVNVPPHLERPGHVKTLVQEAFTKAEEKKQELLKLETENEAETEQGPKWWDEDKESKSDSYQESVKEKESEESLLRRQMASMIQAHERSRKVIEQLTLSRQKRQMWEKELGGTLNPQAPMHIKERSAKLMQKAFRAYFEIKRKRILQCREDEILGMRMCAKINKEESEKADQIKYRRMEQRKKIEQEWTESCEKLKEEFMRRKIDDLSVDYRDFLRSWFRKWFDDIKYFYDIPTDNEGGSVLIMKGEVPEPDEWWEEYKDYLENKKANKNQSAMQRKFAEMQAKEEEMLKKKEELMKKKLQADLMQKMMKNPTQHPGFDFPQSEKTESLLEVIQKYRKDWDDLDFFDTLDVKIRFVHSVDMSNMYAKVKEEIMNTINADMRNELKLLKKALKKDYANSEMTMPEPMKKSRKPKKNKKKNKLKCTMSENIAEKMEDLAFKGILRQYPRTKIEDFLGDHNYAGDDIRCNYESAQPYNGELRSVWWEQCHQVTHGSHFVNIVGPHLSGKTLLVYALATVNDAPLFVLDTNELQEFPSADLSSIAASVLACARAVQPSVIFIRHIYKLYLKKKAPKEETIKNANVLKRILIRKLCKKIQKPEKITVIGSSVDPWQTKSQQLLRIFTNVVLIPNTSYSTVVMLLKQWINDNHTLPRDLDVSGLAHVLQGYSYGYLEENLASFLSPQNIVKIAAYGLSPLELNDYFIEKSVNKVEYEKYLKWYSEHTHWGKKEKMHMNAQKEFKEALKMYEERMAKKKKPVSAVSSAATMHSQGGQSMAPSAK